MEMLFGFSNGIAGGVVAAGVPCRVIREITEDDTAYWKEQEEIYYKNREL